METSKIVNAKYYVSRIPAKPISCFFSKEDDNFSIDRFVKDILRDD